MLAFHLFSGARRVREQEDTELTPQEQTCNHSHGEAAPTVNKQAWGEGSTWTWGGGAIGGAIRNWCPWEGTQERGGYRGLSAFLGTEGWSHILRVLALGSDTRKTNPLAGLKTSEANSRAVRNLASTCEAWAQARLLLN